METLDPIGESARPTSPVSVTNSPINPVTSLSESLPNPILQSKDIIITYNLLLLNLFASKILEYQNPSFNYISPERILPHSKTTQEDLDATQENSAIRILSSLFTVSPRTSTTQAEFPASAVKTYEKWACSVLEAVIWFNSLTGEDIDCLHDVQTEGAQNESLLKLLRLAIRNIPQSGSPGTSATHNMAVIVVSNLLTATFTYQDAFTRLSVSEKPNHNQNNTLNQLKYDARLRSVIRQLTALLIIDRASGLDKWEQEKTRSFVQQRIEQTVVTYMVSEKKKHFVQMHSSTTTQSPKSSTRRSVEKKSAVMSPNTTARNTATTMKTLPRGRKPSIVDNGLENTTRPHQPRRSTITGSLTRPTSPVRKGVVGLKIETEKKEDRKEETNVMKWMYSGITTPLASMGSILTSLNTLAGPSSPTSKSPFHEEEEEEENVATPSTQTMFGIMDHEDPLLSFKNDCGLEDWFIKDVLLHDASLHVCLCVSGLLGSVEDVVDPWHFLPVYAPFSDIYSLGFNTQTLIQLSAEIISFILTSNKRRKSDAANLKPPPSSSATSNQSQYSPSTSATYASSFESSSVSPTSGIAPSIPPTFATIFPTPLGILNTWSYALSAAQLAGEQLGKRILLREAFGKRPITLAGFGLGARVIYFALLEVVKSAEMGDLNAFSLIDSVYLITAPVILELESWTKISAIASGRLVNAYSTKDTVLNLFQTSLAPENDVSIQYIGSTPILPKQTPPLSTSTILNYTAVNHGDVFYSKVENVDLSDTIKLHIKTQAILPQIMERIGFERCFGDARAGGSVFDERSTSPVGYSETRDGVSVLPVEQMPGMTPVMRGRQLSRLVIPLAPTNDVKLESVTIFDANQIFEEGALVASTTSSQGSEGTPDLLNAGTEFLKTPTSAQISKDIIYEPSALILTPLSRPGSNRTLDEDEADREQAKSWVNSGLEGRFF
ncbi:UNVERIFIED_CONTAM: hypothetical protein HDU68_011072 [Siphonaria sp. JEL0065]|nr:hypothetical protein HDU68_011072 [Siphonaria sp. JEL0065]